MPVTIPQTQTILKSYFQTGSEPTQDQFAEFIGTMFYLYQGTLNAANAAIATADATQAAQAGAPGPVVIANIVNNAVVGTLTGVTSWLQQAGFGSNWILTFAAPFANTNYKVLVTGNLPQPTLALGTLTFNLANIHNPSGLILIWP